MKNKDNKNISTRVQDILTPTATELGYEIWDVEFVKEGADKFLRITIDNEDGITIEDCEKFHRAIDPVLDEVDPINEAYVLEVSSPGVEREIKSDKHIMFCTGSAVIVKLYAPQNGVKQFKGVLGGLTQDGKGIVLQTGASETLTFEKNMVAKMSTYFEF